MNKTFIRYVILELGEIESFTSKNLNKYKKVINELVKVKECKQLGDVENDKVIQYVFSKIDKRYKFSREYLENSTFYVLLKLYRNIEFAGATALEINTIYEEFKSCFTNKIELENQLEDMKKDDIINIECTHGLYQIRFLEY